MSDENSADAAPASIAEADAEQLAALAGAASDEDLAAGMSDPESRKRVLDEIFKRMSEHVEPGQIKDVEATVHFRITDAPEGGDDVYEVVFADGAVSVSDEASSADPKVTLTAAPVPFLKLVTGQRSGPAMFMTGKLRIAGDLMFASRMTSFFRIPSA